MYTVLRLIPRVGGGFVTRCYYPFTAGFVGSSIVMLIEFWKKSDMMSNQIGEVKCRSKIDLMKLIRMRTFSPIKRSLS